LSFTATMMLSNVL
jgi:hypothetical protein